MVYFGFGVDIIELLNTFFSILWQMFGDVMAWSKSYQHYQDWTWMLSDVGHDTAVISLSSFSSIPWVGSLLVNITSSVAKGQ